MKRINKIKINSKNINDHTTTFKNCKLPIAVETPLNETGETQLTTKYHEFKTNAYCVSLPSSTHEIEFGPIVADITLFVDIFTQKSLAINMHAITKEYGIVVDSIYNRNNTQ